MVISGNDFYNTPTVVSNGWLLDNSTGSANEKGSPITVCSGGTLSGIGVIGNLVTVNPGGTFAPGTNDGYTIGTLTFTNNASCNGALSLSGNLFFKLNPGGAEANDYVTTLGTAAYTNLGTGTLTVTNVSSNPLTAGEVFQLFSTNVVGGNNLTISGPVAFQNDLAMNGTIVVGVAASSPVSISSVSSMGGKLVMVWQGSAGQNIILLGSTNLLVPISQWTPVLTNAIGASGFSTNSIVINPNLTQQFYLLSVP